MRSVIRRHLAEWANRQVPTEFEVAHMADLVDHYGQKANGAHYMVRGDEYSKLFLQGNGNWVHHHHGVYHHGHGVESLRSHLTSMFGE